VGVFHIQEETKTGSSVETAKQLYMVKI